MRHPSLVLFKMRLLAEGKRAILDLVNHGQGFDADAMLPEKRGAALEPLFYDNARADKRGAGLPDNVGKRQDSLAVCKKVIQNQNVVFRV